MIITLATTSLLSLVLAADPHVIYVNFDGADIEACAYDGPKENALLESMMGLTICPEET